VTIGKPSPRKPQPTALEVRREDRVEYHFPVEIHLDGPREAIDVDQIAAQVYERLIRRIDDV
jgi:hypothetical protein